MLLLYTKRGVYGEDFWKEDKNSKCELVLLPQQVSWERTRLSEDQLNNIHGTLLLSSNNCFTTSWDIGAEADGHSG